MTASTATSLFGTLIQDLSDDELLAAGPDVVAAASAIGATADPVAQYLLVHKLGASLLADQITVKQEVTATVFGTAISALSAAMAAAKARQAPPLPAT